MKAIDHGIDFIHGGQSAEVLKQKDAARLMVNVEGQLKSWTTLITTCDDLCDAHSNEPES